MANRKQTSQWPIENRHHNGQTKKDKGTNNDLQSITHKTKDRVTRVPLRKLLTSGQSWAHCYCMKTKLFIHGCC
jgi:hypothetical protein